MSSEEIKKNRKRALKTSFEYFLSDSLDIAQKHDVENPLKYKEETKFLFRNHLYDNEEIISKKNFLEFFSRNEILKAIKTTEFFPDIIELISAHKIIKELFPGKTGAEESLISQFLINYTEEINGFEFDRNEFNSLFSDFWNFLSQGTLKISYFTPLFQLESKIPKKKFDNITLERITPDQFKIIKESFVGKELATPSFLYNLGYVLHTSISSKNNLIKEDSLAESNFNDFINCGLILSRGNLTIGPLYRNYTNWTRFSSTHTPISAINLGSRNYKFTKTSSENLEDFYNSFRQLNLNVKGWKFIEIAIDRFSSSIQRRDSIDKIIDLYVALESLFSTPGENSSLKIAYRTAVLLATNDEEKEDYWKFVQEQSKIRNNILHGRQSAEDVKPDNLTKFEDLIRQSIRKFLNISKNFSDSKLIQNGKSKKSNPREKIIEELDTGLINPTRFEDFSKITTGIFD